MKKVLYVLDDGKRSFTYARIAGFSRAIRRAKEPVNLYIFRSAGFAEYEETHNCGEYNIWHLPDFSDFDGIFLDINNYQQSSENPYGAKGTEYVIRAAAMSGKPVVALAKRVADFYYVGIDNHAAMTSMIAYLHGQRGLTDFWFLMGPADNYENSVRTDALREYCATHGLPAEESRFYAESYALESGIRGFRKLYEARGGRLPQAIICANDPIAVGACRAAAEKGYRVPDDLFVTGFDNLDESAYLSPTLTTVDQLRWGMGDACIDVMQRIWQSGDAPRTTFTPTELILRESTGSPRPSEEAITGRVEEAIKSEMYTEAFNNQLCAVQYRLPGCDSIEEMCAALEKCIPAMQCSGLWLVMDKELSDYGGQVAFDPADGSLRSGADSLHTEGYPETMELIFSWEEGKGASYPKQMIRGIFPTFDAEDSGLDYLFVPLHFMDATVGYLVIRDCVKMLHTRNIAPVANTLTMAMRSFFAGKKLEYMNEMLSGISMKDNLTGLCNRLGYHHLATRLFKKTHDSGGRLGVIFIDMDRMKYYNDTFGHACGDDAIRSVSAAIRKSIPEDAIPVRYGGDEFLVVTPADSRETVTALVDRILNAIPEEAEKRKMPDIPGISTGFVLTDPMERLSLNDYVEQADRLMYHEKKRKQAE